MLVPRGQSIKITTRRGRAVHIRPSTPADAALLVDLFRQLSPETLRRRFLGPVPSGTDERICCEARRLAAVEPGCGATLIAALHDAGKERCVGLAQLIVEPADPTAAEVSFVIRDDYQGEGLGRALLEQIIQVARASGVLQLWAVTRADNDAALGLFRHCGCPVTGKTASGETTITISTCEPRSTG